MRVRDGHTSAYDEGKGRAGWVMDERERGRAERKEEGGGGPGEQRVVIRGGYLGGVAVRGWGRYETQGCTGG